MDKGRRMGKGLITFLLASAIMTGCAARQATILPAGRPVAAEVDNLISQADRAYAAGQFEMSIRIYDRILNEYESGDGGLEVAVLTNMALASLELGDRENFLRYAEEADLRSQSLKHIAKNTAFVLSLAHRLRNENPERDLRVSARLHRSIQTILGGE